MIILYFYIWNLYLQRNMHTHFYFEQIPQLYKLVAVLALNVLVKDWPFELLLHRCWVVIVKTIHRDG